MRRACSDLLSPWRVMPRAAVSCADPTISPFAMSFSRHVCLAARFQESLRLFTGASARAILVAKSMSRLSLFGAGYRRFAIARCRPQNGALVAHGLGQRRARLHNLPKYARLAGPAETDAVASSNCSRKWVRSWSLRMRSRTYLLFLP